MKTIQILDTEMRAKIALMLGAICMDYAKEIVDKVESKKISVYEADEMFTEAFVQPDLEKLGEEVLTVFHKGLLLHNRGKLWGATIAEIKGEVCG